MTGVVRRLFPAVRDRFALDLHGIHGVAHWARVHHHGLRIARAHGLRADVVELFAFLHDSCRENEGTDRDHGARAADLARHLHGHSFDLDDDGLERLCIALDGHSHGRIGDDLLVQACWDADRLDLARLGMTVDPRRLGTAEARQPSTIHRARDLARAWRRRAGW